MPHSLILGMTESGKTTLAKRVCQAYLRRGINAVVLDPLGDPEWRGDLQLPEGALFQTSDADEFLEVFWSNTECAAFIDEAGDEVGRYNTVMQQTATRGRHWGHNVHYVSQRGTLLAQTVRDQCSHLFLFATSLKDCKTHADEWNKPQLLEAATFPAGEYFHVTRFGVCERGNIFKE